MNDCLFEYPKSTVVGRVLPKSKIYEHNQPNTKIREYFTQQVEKIVWQYKLASETLNLPSSADVPEIQIFKVLLKTSQLKADVLRCIDSAIPYPILFEIEYNGKIKAMAAYKKPSEADPSKWILENYYETAWISQSSTRKALPVVLDMTGLYKSLLISVMPYPPLAEEPLPNSVSRINKILALKRDIERQESSLQKEKQFNRKMLIYNDLQTLKRDFDTLLRIGAPP